MRIEAVIVCKDYGDFLAQTLPENIHQLDHLIVVTHPSDKETIAVCRKYSIDCVQTTCMHEDGDKFNKGRAINLGLGHARGGGWLLHLDADVVLPHRFRDMLHRAKIEDHKLYGADRVNVIGYDNWLKIKHKLHPHYQSGYFVEPNHHGHPLGSRIIHHEHGYVPIGYFQLWHSGLGKKYPIHQGNAEHTDVLFAAQWSRRDRVLLPETVVLHLESEKCPMGTNWHGRKTRRFGPHADHCHPKPYCGDHGKSRKTD